MNQREKIGLAIMLLSIGSLVLHDGHEKFWDAWFFFSMPIGTWLFLWPRK